MIDTLLPQTTVPALAQGRVHLARGLAVVALLLSGAAGLAYQIVWTQQLGVWLGHDFIAAAAIVAAFFAGLALGAATIGRVVARARQPGRAYAVLELVIAAWALLLALALPWLAPQLLELIGAQPSALRHWFVAFVGPALLLLPATAAMGATLPALDALARRLGTAQGRDPIGTLYAANTAGAVLGVLATAFWLAPVYGLRATLTLAVLLNLASAALAWRALGAVGVPARDSLLAPRPGLRAAQARLALGGLLGIGYEVLAIRVAGRIAENTVYTLALLLAVYLVGTALGAALWQRHAGTPDPRRRERLAAATLLAMLIGGLALVHGDTLIAAGGWLAQGPAGALAGEALLAAAAFLLPTVAMGALFAEQCAEARAQGGRLGPLLAINTGGAMLAAPLIALIALPQLGAGASLALLAAGYLALVTSRPWRRAAPLVAATGLGAWLALSPAPGAPEVPSGARLLEAREGVMGLVTVTESGDGSRVLRIDNHAPEGASPVSLSERREAWLPLLLHPAPREVLLLGLGAGGTAMSAAADPRLAVTAVELLPEVVEVLPRFVPEGSRLPTIRVADARRHVRTMDGTADVIVADLFHPARGGTASLYTVEHFDAVRARLADGGLFCQWLPLHQLDLDSLRAIVAAYLRVFPDAVAVLATNSLDTPVVGLMARAGAPLPMPDEIAARLAAAGTHSAGLQLDDAWAVAGSVIGDAASLSAFAAGHAPNRDDHPVVAYRAPRIAYAVDDHPRERLLTLIDALDADPARVFGPAQDAAAAAQQARVAAYWRARDAYLRAGRDAAPQRDPRALLAQLRGPLTEVLRISPDFRPAWEPLFRLALAVRGTDPAQARELLATLAALAPQRREAPDALAAMPALP